MFKEVKLGMLYGFDMVLKNVPVEIADKIEKEANVYLDDIRDKAWKYENMYNLFVVLNEPKRM